MSVIEAISMMSKSGYSDRVLLEYIDKHYDEIECELNGEEILEGQQNRANRAINMLSRGPTEKSSNVLHLQGTCAFT